MGCTGKTVMVVVFCCSEDMCCTALSIDALLSLVVDDWVLLMCFVLRQAVAIGIMKAIRSVMIMSLFFMVAKIYSKGNTFGRNVQQDCYG